MGSTIKEGTHRKQGNKGNSQARGTMRSLAFLTFAASVAAAVPSDPSAPDYYDAIREDDSGYGAVLPGDDGAGSNMIRFTSEDGDTSYRLADVTALLPYTFGSGSTASGNGLITGGDDEDQAIAAESDAAVRPRSSVQDHAAALLLACYHFNTKKLTDTLDIKDEVLAKAYFETNVRLTASLYDTQFSPIESTRLLTKVLDRSPARDKPLPQAIVGAYRSACTSPTAILSGVNGIPQISYHSSGTDFDNKEQYPLFARTVPSSGGDAQAVVDYLQSLGIKYLGVIFVTDAFGSAYQKSLQDAAGEANPPIRTDSVSFSYKSASGGRAGFTSAEIGPDGELEGGEEGSQEIKNAIQSLKHTKYKYFVAIVGEEHYSRVMREAYAQDIAGKDYVWLFTGGVDRRTFQDEIAQYKKDTSLAIATQGIGLIQVEGGQTSDIDYANPSERKGSAPTDDGSGYQRFRKSWREAMNNDNLVKYFRSKQLEIEPAVGGYDFNTIEFSADPSQHMYFVYDAIVSLGLSMSHATARGGVNGTTLEYPTGQNIYDSLLQNVTFEGASSDVQIDPNSGTRKSESVTYTVWNARQVNLEGEEDKVGFDLVPTSHYVARKGTKDDITEAEVQAAKDGEDAEEPQIPEIVMEWVAAKDDAGDRAFVYADGTTVPPEELPPADEQNNYIGKSGRIAGLVLMGIVMLLAFLAMTWTAGYQGSRVVRASRPLFLSLVSVGCLIMASAIIPLSQEETTASKAKLDSACMTAPWLYVIGFAVAFSALFTKTWTLNKVFRNPEIDCIVVTWKDLLKTLAALLIVNVALLLSWTLVSPLTWQRFDKDSEDQFGRTTETYATCTSEKSLPFVIVIIVVNLGALLLANFQAYKARDIQTEYQESRYVAISMASILQAWCMGIPIMIVVKEAPQAKFFVEAGIIFVTCTAVLLLIFTPKLLAVRSDRRKEEEERRRNRLRDVNARAGRGQFDDEEEEDNHGGKKEQHPQDVDDLEKDKGDEQVDNTADEENPQGGSLNGQESSAAATFETTATPEMAVRQDVAFKDVDTSTSLQPTNISTNAPQQTT
mmetsp:Transcript_46585/g.141108  ORF Transcript_46585/g.141108 Transcript_46585/m.141108 type:complete len:1062 (-) Transcript_46585:222-3407(-)